MGGKIEAADRELSARLQEAGINPGGACGLTFRLLVCDQLAPHQVAQTLGVAESTVANRVSLVRTKLRAAEDAYAQDAVPEREPADADDPDPRLAAGLALLEAIRNRQGEGGSEHPLACGPLINAREARNIISEGTERREAAHRAALQCDNSARRA